MYIVKADNADVSFSIAPPTVTDSEGNAIGGYLLSYEAESSDPNVVAVTLDQDTLTGTLHFGAPGLASINVTALTPGLDNALQGSFGAQFTVTAGNPAAITGGGISIDGLTESPDVPPATPPGSGTPEDETFNDMNPIIP